MKKLVKILPIIMIVLMMMTVVSPVLATSGQVGEVKIDMKTDGDGVTKVSNVGNAVLGIIRVVGTILSVGVLMVIGIKYMMGSAEEKAEYKKTMIPYIIGAVVLFAAVHIAGAVVGLSGMFTGA